MFNFNSFAYFSLSKIKIVTVRWPFVCGLVTRCLIIFNQDYRGATLPFNVKKMR